jgi:hypothetical protein
MGRIDEAEPPRPAAEAVRDEAEALASIGLRDLGFVEMWELRR